MTPLTVYPEVPLERTRWIEAHRGSKNPVSATRPYAALVEEELGPDFTLWPTATLFLTNRECPFRCLMCDLWKNTLDETVPVGAISGQVERGLSELGPARAVKLYNSGSFFDPGAIPIEDYAEIGKCVRGFERVIVENHTAFLSGRYRERVLRFRDAIRPATLEIAIGLETAHPGVLERLNKRMSLQDFHAASQFLSENEIALRTFLLVRPPFLDESEALEWAMRSLDEACSAGAGFAALIPVRDGNGAMEALAREGNWSPPSLATVEATQEYGLTLAPGKMRVTVDLWDIERFVQDPGDTERLRRIFARNCSQGGASSNALQCR